LRRKVASFCRETLGKAVLQAVCIHTEAPEWLWWLVTAQIRRDRKFAEGERREESS
jgi:hypothetical protein